MEYWIGLFTGIIIGMVFISVKNDSKMEKLKYKLEEMNEYLCSNCKLFHCSKCKYNYKDKI